MKFLGMGVQTVAYSLQDKAYLFTSSKTKVDYLSTFKLGRVLYKEPEMDLFLLECPLLKPLNIKVRNKIRRLSGGDFLRMKDLSILPRPYPGLQEFYLYVEGNKLGECLDLGIKNLLTKGDETVVWDPFYVCSELHLLGGSPTREVKKWARDMIYKVLF